MRSSIWGWLKNRNKAMFVGERMRCLWMYNYICVCLWIYIYTIYTYFLYCRIIYANTCYIWMIHITFSLNTYMWVHLLQHLPWKKTYLFFKHPYHPKQIQPTKAQADLFRLLQSFVAEFVARHGSLMQSLWLDEITLKANQPEMWKAQETQKNGDKLNKPTFFYG